MKIDHETTEALRDEPELLAIADALQSAGDRLEVPEPRRARRRMPVRAAAVAVAAVIALVLSSPWSGSSGPSFVDRALAAIGNEPVLHVVVRYSIGERIDLRTGRTTRSHRDGELWYDARRHVFRSVARMDGRVIVRRSGSGNLDSEPFLLTNLYRQALQQGKLHKSGESVVRGHRVIVVETRQPRSDTVFRAYLDEKTYQLVRMQFLVHGRVGSQIDVLAFETVSRREARLPLHPRPAPFSSGSGAVTETGSGAFVGRNALSEARTAFGRPALWPGRSIDGHRLIASQLERRTVGSGGRTFRGRTFVLDYGPRSSVTDEAYVEIEEAPARSPLFRLVMVYPPPPGFLDLTSGQTSAGNGPERTQWTGVLQRDGFAIQLTSWSRSTLIAAARALHPLP